MNYKDRKIMRVAQEFGYTTASQFANFLNSYKPTIEINKSGRELVYLSLL